MPLDLNTNLSWKKVLAAGSPEDTQWLAMLSDLQGNILKGHGRLHTANVFLHFPADKIDGAKAFLRMLSATITSAVQQLMDATLYKTVNRNAGPFTAVFLTASGYRALGLESVMPEGEAFRAGMDARAGLDDTAKGSWDGVFQGDIHAMVLLAADDEDKDNPVPRDQLLEAFNQRIALASGAVTVLGVELGDQLRNSAGHGIEHFGYVDGRSQPLMLNEDIAEEMGDKRGGGIWDPTIPLSQVLVPDTGGKLDVSCGSYFVFRKLEQDVKGFKNMERKLAELNGGIGELAGASVIGRFENGFPIEELGSHQTKVPDLPDGKISNAFDYSSDEQGLKCPYAAHIRKTNPRRADAQQHLMARRGITYGVRSDNPNGDDLSDKPSGNVGLLFMSYQSSIENQFEFTQVTWANNKDFDFRSPVQPVGIDPIIGQPAKASPAQFLKEWGKSLGERNDDIDFTTFVRLKGGAYMFAPAISFFRQLAGS